MGATTTSLTPAALIARLKELSQQSADQEKRKEGGKGGKGKSR